MDLRELLPGEVPTVVPSPHTPVERGGSTSNLPNDLALVVGSWSRLPAAIKAGILALVQASDHSLCKPPDEIDV